MRLLVSNDSHYSFDYVIWLLTITETSNAASRSNSKDIPDTVNGAQPTTAQVGLGTSDDISVSEVDKRVAEAVSFDQSRQMTGLC